MGEPVLIETTRVNSFADSDSWVYVVLGNGYVRKRVEDVQPGDLIVVRNEGVCKTLEEIVPILEESARYLAAKYVLHETNRQGRFVPRLRTLLLRGLSAGDNRPDLEARILLDDARDFSPQDYSTFRERVSSLVNASPAAIDNWLHGETLAPRDWANFSRLAEINPEFTAIHASYDQPTGFHASYELYIGARRTVTSYLARRDEHTPRERDEPRERAPGVRGRFTPEIELVVGRFLGEIDREHDLGRVTYIKRAHRERAGGVDHGETPNPGLSRGLITTNEVAPGDLPLIDLQIVLQRQYLLRHALHDAISMGVTSLGNDSGHRLENIFFREHLFTRLIRICPLEISYLDKVFARVAHPSSSKRTVINERLPSVFAEFLAHLGDGSLDAACRIPPHTLANLIDALNQHNSALPASYHRENKLIFDRFVLKQRITDHGASPEVKRTYAELNKETEAVIRYNRQHYTGLILQKHLLYPYVADAVRVRTLWKVGDPLDISSSDLQQARGYYETQGVVFFSQRDVRLLLEQIGLSGVFKLYAQHNFLQPALGREKPAFLP